MFRLRDISFVILILIISPLGSITPVSFHNRTTSYVHCMRVAVPCVPNSVSPLRMQMLCCQDWQNSREFLDTVCLAHGVCIVTIETKTDCILSERNPSVNFQY